MVVEIIIILRNIKRVLKLLQIIFTWRNDGGGMSLMLKHLISPFTSPVTMFYIKKKQIAFLYTNSWSITYWCILY